MDTVSIQTVIVGCILSGAVTACLTIAGMNVRLEWLRRDIDRLEKRVDALSPPVKPATPLQNGD